MTKECPWWLNDGYFPFEAGKDGYPCSGQVIQHYRLKKAIDGKALRQCDLARMLRISERAVWAMENAHEGLDSFNRRMELVTLLDIPPVLLKLDASSISGICEHRHPGQVVRKYRKKKKKDNGKSWTQADLAILLEISGKSVRSMENHNTGLDSISRRQLLTKILDIPPALLGLNALHLLTEENILKPAIPRMPKYVTLNDKKLTKYQSFIPTYWNMHYTSNDSLKEFDNIIYNLHKMIAYVNQKQQEHIRWLLCHYHQLALNAARDQGDLETALAHADLAIILAERIESNEVHAAALYRRGLTHFDAGNFPAAARDLVSALPLLKGTSPQLQGMVNMEAGRFSAYVARGSIEQLKAEKLLDRTQNIVLSNRLGEDESYIKLDKGRYYIGRAATLLALQRPTAALEHLDDADRLTEPGYVRRHAYIDILRARAYFAQGLFDCATDLALDSLRTCLQIHSESNIADIARLYASLSQTSFGNSLTLARLGLLLPLRR